MPRDPDLVKAVNEWLAPAIAAGEPARVLKSYLER
jgi:ABC-type amino acid transport substrate-binding protein